MEAKLHFTYFMRFNGVCKSLLDFIWKIKLKLFNWENNFVHFLLLLIFFFWSTLLCVQNLQTP